MSRVALLEDDLDTSNDFSKALREAEIDVDQYFTTEDAIEGIKRYSYDGYIMDLEINYIPYDGLGIIDAIKEKLRLQSNHNKTIPVLVVSGHPETEYKSICHRFFSAWDHLQKPVEPLGKLVAMTKMMLRFSHEEYPLEKLNFGSSQLRIEKGAKVLWNGKKVIGITMTLFRFLEILIDRKNEEVTYKELHDLTSSYESDPVRMKASVRAHIKRLKDSFLEVDSEFDRIKPVFGKGYSWVND